MKNIFMCTIVILIFSALVFGIDQRDYLNQFNRKDWDTAPGDARFLEIMIKAMGAKRGLEIGTYRGYGSMFMAVGFEHTDGHLWTFEKEQRYANEAIGHLKTIGLDHRVTVQCVDALQILKMPSEPFDFVFIDAEKEQYYDYFLLIEPKLKVGSVVIADNAIRRKEAMKTFLDYVRKNSRTYDMAIIRTSDLKDDGVAVIYKRK